MFLIKLTQDIMFYSDYDVDGPERERVLFKKGSELYVNDVYKERLAPYGDILDVTTEPVVKPKPTRRKKG